MAGAGREAQPIVAGLARPVGGDGDDIFAVLGEHGVDPAVGRGLAVDFAVVIAVLRAVRARSSRKVSSLAAVRVIGDALAALGLKPIMVGIFAATRAGRRPRRAGR